MEILRTMEIRTAELGGSNEWAPVHLRHRGALHLRFSEGLLVGTSMILGSAKRVAFALQSCACVWIVDGAMRQTAAFTSSAPEPCTEQGHQSDPVASCSSSSVEPAGSRPFRCVSSRPYGRAPIPVKLGAAAPWPRRVQHWNAAADIGECQVKSRPVPPRR